MRKSIYSRQQAALREYLRNARKDAGLTQTQLANKLRKPQSFVAKFELGERRLDVIELIEILDVIGADLSVVVKVLKDAKAPRSTP